MIAEQRTTCIEINIGVTSTPLIDRYRCHTQTNFLLFEKVSMVYR